MPDEHEGHIEAVISCPSCGSNYRLEHQHPNCENCGAVLPPPVARDGGSHTQRTFLGVGAALHPLADELNELHRESGFARDAGQPSLKQQVDGAVTCGWCSHQYAARPASPNCERCGGVLPLPPSADPGPEPPPVPRQLPQGFWFRIFVKQNLGGIIGLGLLVVTPVFLIVAFPIAALTLLGGGLLAWFNFASAYRRYVALQRGTPVLGKIERVEEFGERDQGSPLFRVYFRFNVADQPLQGLKFTYDPAVRQHFVGEPIWVVYLPQRPDYYAIWPPLA